MEHRPCTKCGEVKALTEFYKQKGSSDGHRPECKACILRIRAEQYATRPEMRERLKRQARERRGTSALLPRQCRTCGTDMRPSRTGEPGVCVFCKRLAGYKVNITKAERLAIYERDGWTCQLCGRAVEPSLHPNHTFAATLDHIRPRSATLFVDDSPENLRLAHRACNSARGARAA